MSLEGLKDFFTKPVSLNGIKELFNRSKIEMPKSVKQKQPGGKIWLFNPFSNSFFEFSANQLTKVEIPSFNGNYCASFLGIEDLTIDTFEINRFIPLAEQADAVELKAYDELALEPTLEYKFVFIDLPDEAIDGQNKKVDVFIANTAQLEAKFAAAKAASRYIDFIGYAPLCIKSLYEQRHLSDEGVHAFVYFYDSSSFLAVYKNGQFLYSKALKLTLKTLAERFSELFGERLAPDEFCDRFTKGTLCEKGDDAPMAETRLFSELFTNIADTLMHAKRVHGIDRYSGIYVATDYGIVNNISETARLYLETPVRDFAFTLGIQTDGFVDIMTQLLALTASTQLANADDRLNFSIFKRPPPLLKRDAGRALVISAVSFAVAFGYPVFELTIHNAWLKHKQSSLTAEQSELHAKRTADEQYVAQLLRKQDEIQKNIAVEDALFEKQNKMLKEIFFVKNDYPSRSIRLIEICDILARYDVGLVAVEMNATDTVLRCKASSGKKITGFLRHVGHMDKFIVHMSQIQKDANTTAYRSTINLRYTR